MIFWIFGYVAVLFFPAVNLAAFLTMEWERYKEFFLEMNGVIFWGFVMALVPFALFFLTTPHSLFGFGAYMIAVVLILISGLCGFANYMTYGNILGK